MIFRFQKPTEDKLNFEDSCQRQAHVNPSQQNLHPYNVGSFRVFNEDFFSEAATKKKQSTVLLELTPQKTQHRCLFPPTTIFCLGH